ncbi:MAG: asparagine synthase (glutamine-hydrolyzing) [Flavobacteriales bacterium]|jgi:asparagine synthase (glutamine-hydrolysing)|nr:asparagine synthase (glutamine-hydrolyzing) [Flavobacteriales bacterium]MDP4716545.1 asparagine synthase (glutamine-hydrolyzing) [Flavobacteriales bacterium]MDP4730664.1 asparagine synthase (glutamine-hydrolyzing) [Flavobacteriales bacterium]MDP4819186.1 asparagine synthase (glutamine-hydrolyzing) [Flavobacteriales bacterium]MDP4950672.1 asparagine synthase (glutamine-hydrolyzing) [Flavobacteriales bacterium]
MCGISAIIQYRSDLPIRKVLERMNNKMAHRGPDADGQFINENIGLGHRRLSIIDTEKSANQPMLSSNKNWVIAFNGEIYNYVELKANELQGVHFQTESDTEVILELFNKYGTEAISKLKGMFAFVLHHIPSNETFVVRDRYGMKPLYYSIQKLGCLVASELRALLASDLVPRKFNRSALEEYIETQTVCAPNTLIEKVQLLEAGHYLHFKRNEISKHCYYRLLSDTSYELSDKKTAQDLLRSSMKESVEQHMRADVPFGAFLSGGIDSSLLVGLMSEVRSEKINTFQISFEEEAFDERKYAQLVAKKFSTNHHEINLSATEFLKDIPAAIAAIDFPSGDGPNTYAVSKAAKEAGITVAISGLGGDELFAGYPVFQYMNSIEKSFALKLSYPLRKSVSLLLSSFSSNRSLRKKAELLGLRQVDLAHAFPLVRKVWNANELLTRKTKHFEIEQNYKFIFEKNAPLLNRISAAEIESYMQHVLLRDSDQMSMAHSLEIRVPFLDHNVVELATHLSNDLKYPTSPKKFLTETFADIFPDEVVNRKKMGFTLPWSVWMKNELKEFTESGFQELYNQEVVNEKVLKNAWSKFLMGSEEKSFISFWHLSVLGHWMKNNKINFEQ